MPMQSHAQFVCVITLITCVLMVIVTTDGVWLHEWALGHAEPLRVPHQGNGTCRMNVCLVHPVLQNTHEELGTGTDPCPWPWCCFRCFGKCHGEMEGGGRGVHKAP